MGSSDEVIALARKSGLPVSVGSTNRPGATTLSGNVSWHASDNAVDFMGESQDALAQYFMKLPTLEVIHHSNKTGTNYATSRGKPFQLTGALLQQHKNHLHVAMDEGVARTQLGSAGGGVIDPLDPVGTIQTIVGYVPNPATVTQALGNIGSSLASSAMTVDRIAGLVTKALLPSTLIRGMALVFGTVFILIGIWFLGREIRDSNG